MSQLQIALHALGVFHQQRRCSSSSKATQSCCGHWSPRCACRQLPSHYHAPTLRNLQEFDHYIMSVSPQAVASLAADCSLPLAESYARLGAFLSSIGVHCMTDTAAATAAALHFTCQEFMTVFRKEHAAGSQRLQAAEALLSAGHADRPPLRLPLPAAGHALNDTWQVFSKPGEIAFVSSAGSSTAAAASAPKKPARTQGRPPWQAPPVTLAISASRTKIIPEGNITSVNLADDGGPIVNLDGGASAAGVVVDSLSGTAVDSDGTRLQLTGPDASQAPRAKQLVDLCAMAGVPLPGAPAAVAALPVLASACPGWVCYAEKTHPAALRHVSRVKSPQALAGEIIKSPATASAAAVDCSRVYHATLMPCFDKKLEASRRDMYSEKGGEEGVKLVDCVITPEEVGALLQERGFGSLADVPLPPAAAAAASPGGSPWNVLAWGGGVTGGAVTETDAAGSGGYAAAVLRHAVWELLGMRLEGRLPWVEGRNADLQSVAVTVDGTRIVSVATAYGFRNIQTAVTRMKTGKCTWDYVEAMACGGGCPNGGGQLRVRPSTVEDGSVEKPTPAQQRARVADVSTLMASRAPLAGAAAAAAHAAVAGRETTAYHAMPTAGTSGAVAW